jgi:hypothetical protein
VPGARDAAATAAGSEAEEGSREKIGSGEQRDLGARSQSAAQLTAKLAGRSARSCPFPAVAAAATAGHRAAPGSPSPPTRTNGKGPLVPPSLFSRCLLLLNRERKG